jgi:hypothetical protein
MTDGFTEKEISGIILAHELPFIVGGDKVDTTVKISPVGLDDEGIVSEAVVDIKIIKQKSVDFVNMNFNITDV